MMGNDKRLGVKQGVLKLGQMREGREGWKKAEREGRANGGKRRRGKRREK